MKTYLKYLLTGVVVLIAAVLMLYKYWNYVVNPWTRDGQVRAQVIQITPRVSGPIVKLPIKDNQIVKTGDLLFEIDPRTFKADLGAPGDQNAQVRLTKSKVRSAELNLEFTQQKAPVDGYVTNLNLRLGS
jgi:multidrug resistance efflux pump